MGMGMLRYNEYDFDSMSEAQLIAFIESRSGHPISVIKNAVCMNYNKLKAIVDLGDVAGVVSVLGSIAFLHLLPAAALSALAFYLVKWGLNVFCG